MKEFLKINYSRERIYGLDILRCLAILFVMLTHGNLYLSREVSGFLNHFIVDGVGIFFVLSGYLIGSIFLKTFEKEPITIRGLLSFWKRRWFRTLPNYYLILVLLIILWGLNKGNWNFIYTWRFFIFSQNLFSPHPVFFSEAWSLSVEEWFYFLIPLVILGIYKILSLNTKRAVLWTALLIIAGITFFRYYRFSEIEVQSFQDWDMNFRKQVFTRLDAIMIGVIGAYISFFYNKLWERNHIILLIAGILMLYHRKFIPLDYGSIYVCVFSFTTSAIGTLFTIPFLSHLKKGKGMIYKIVTYISIVSYSMYLLNYSLVREIILGYPAKDVGIWGGLANYVLFWAITVILSILLYRYYEKPTTVLRDKRLTVTWNKLLGKINFR